MVRVRVRVRVLALETVARHPKITRVAPPPHASKHRLVQSPCGGDTVTFCTIVAHPIF